MERARAWAELDLAALDRNLERVARRAGPEAEVLLVVKADAYGHGATAVARRAAARGVESFCVGTAAEAVELRRAGVGGRVLLLGTLVDEESEAVLDHGVELCVHSGDRCERLDALARRRGVRARVHLNVDTGMGRLGVGPERALELVDQVRRSPGLELVGLMSHLAASAGFADPSAVAQAGRFAALCRELAARGALPPLVHLYNSAGLFTEHLLPGGGAGLLALPPGTRLGVRPGISAYGMLAAHVPGADELEPVLSLSTRVVFFKDVPPGTAIGYDGTWRARRGTRVATLPIGYHDGMNWRAGNRAQVLVRGRRVPVIGRVSMDYTTIDVTDVPGVEVGDEVRVIGRQGDERVDALELARVCDTIAYEVTCTIGRRVPRVLVDGRSADALVPAVATRR